MNVWIESINQSYGINLSLKDVFLGFMTPFFLAAFVWEFLYLRKRKVNEQFISIRESIVNFTLGGTYQISETIISFLFLAIFLSWVEQFQLFTIPINGLFSIVLLFILEEFCYYWYHRSSHRIRWFWCAHVVHHSSEMMNFSTAMRQSIMYPFSGNFLFFLPAVLIGFSAEAVFFCYAVNLAYQYFIHTQQVPKLHPIVEYIFNTPSHHRAHHGKNPEYIDKNYGGVLIIFDRMFNTFAEEHEDNPVDYGIVNQIDTLNIIEINFHEWRDMIKDILQPGNVLLRIQHLWRPPEWRRPSKY